MKDSIPLVCCFIATCTSLLAQTTPLKNYAVDNTGYSALFPANPGKAEVSLSDNELQTYSLEVNHNNKHFGLVMVLLEDKFVNSDKETLESLLISYMNFLKLSYDITSSIGYIKGQINASNPLATGIQDFWEDEKGLQWAVRGWVTNDVVAVLYVHSDKAENTHVPYEFLDGFSFKKPPRKGLPFKGTMK